jgi:ribosomal protein S18 acetylase RimI-like enzyme
MLPPLCPADTGRRVSLRAVREDGSAFDTVGPVVSLTRHRVVVEGRRGEVALGWGTSPEPGLPPVIAGRVVQPDLAATAMQQIAQAVWPPSQSVLVDGWEMRWGGPAGPRANSVRVAADPGAGLGAALDRAHTWYHERGSRPALQIPRPWLAEDLRAAGWSVVRSVRLMTLRGLTDVPSPDIQVNLRPAPDAAWLDLLAGHDPADATAVSALGPAPGAATAAYASALDSHGNVVGVGRACVAEGWVGLTSIVTAPQHRRKGVGAVVTSALMGWAAEQRATGCFLQVLETNTAGLGLYRSLGFSTHHAYDYWEPAVS